MSKLNPDTVKKIWQVVKTIVEVIIAALAGAATGATAKAAGFLAMLQ